MFCVHGRNVKLMVIQALFGILQKPFTSLRLYEQYAYEFVFIFINFLFYHNLFGSIKLVNNVLKGNE